MDKTDVLMELSAAGRDDLCQWANENLHEWRWMPIKTAPKDGTDILICTHNQELCVVSYDDIFSAPWRIRNNEGLNEFVPTHWMPLPEATNLWITE